MSERDPYLVLGVERGADDAQIKSAYRTLAKKYHPDQNAGNAEAESKFKELNSAYDSIKTAEKREEYEFAASRQQQGHNFRRHANGFEFSFGGGFPGGQANLDEILRQMHAQQNAPRNRHYTTGATISFHDAFRGCEVSLKTETREIRVKVPPGVDNGTRIRVGGAGESVHANLPPGDLYVTIMVIADPNFHRDGKMLLSTVEVDAIDAIIGAKINVTTIDGDAVELQVAPGTQHGHHYRLSGRGMPLVGTDQRGDHIVTVQIKTPTDLSPKQMEMLRDIKGLQN